VTGPASGHSPGPDTGRCDGRAGAVHAGQLAECSGDDLDAIGRLIAAAFGPLAPSRAQREGWLREPAKAVRRGPAERNTARPSASSPSLLAPYGYR
jgi:hypothetical protein